MHAPITSSLKPSESKAPQERAQKNTAEARSIAQVNEGGRNRRTTRTTRLTRHPALVRSADIALTRRAQRAPTYADDHKTAWEFSAASRALIESTSARSYSAPYQLGESTRTTVNLGWGLVIPAAKYNTRSDRHRKDTRSQPHSFQLIVQ